MGPILTHNLGVRDIVTAVVGNIFVSDEPESISYLDTLLFGAYRDFTYALAQLWMNVRGNCRWDAYRVLMSAC